MKKSEIKELVNSAAKTKELCEIFFRYDPNESYLFPLMVSEKLFLSANEDYFMVDGFTVRRFVDVEKAEIKRDKCAEIIKLEGVLNKVKAPQIDITDWYSVFLSLSKLNINIIVEKESLDIDECQFAVGRIEKVLKSKIIFKAFDEEGIWQNECYEIPYSQITSITFDCRYVNVFSKYV